MLEHRPLPLDVLHAEPLIIFVSWRNRYTLVLNATQSQQTPIAVVVGHGLGSLASLLQGRQQQ